MGDREVRYGVRLEPPGELAGEALAELAGMLAPLLDRDADEVEARLRAGPWIAARDLDGDEARQLVGVLRSLGADATLVGPETGAAASGRPLFEGDEGAVPDPWRSVLTGPGGRPEEAPTGPVPVASGSGRGRELLPPPGRRGGAAATAPSSPAGPEAGGDDGPGELSGSLPAPSNQEAPTIPLGMGALPPELLGEASPAASERPADPFAASPSTGAGEASGDAPTVRVRAADVAQALGSGGAPPGVPAQSPGRKGVAEAASGGPEAPPDAPTMPLDAADVARALGSAEAPPDASTVQLDLGGAERARSGDEAPGDAPTRPLDPGSWSGPGGGELGAAPRDRDSLSTLSLELRGQKEGFMRAAVGAPGGAEPGATHPFGRPGDGDAPTRPVPRGDADPDAPTRRLERSGRGPTTRKQPGVPDVPVRLPGGPGDEDRPTHELRRADERDGSPDTAALGSVSGGPLIFRLPTPAPVPTEAGSIPREALLDALTGGLEEAGDAAVVGTSPRRSRSGPGSIGCARAAATGTRRARTAGPRPARTASGQHRRVVPRRPPRRRRRVVPRRRRRRGRAVPRRRRRRGRAVPRHRQSRQRSGSDPTRGRSDPFRPAFAARARWWWFAPTASARFWRRRRRPPPLRRQSPDRIRRTRRSGRRCSPCSCPAWVRSTTGSAPAASGSPWGPCSSCRG